MQLWVSSLGLILLSLGVTLFFLNWLDPRGGFEGCLIRITGESVLIRGCEVNKELAELIPKLKPLVL